MDNSVFMGRKHFKFSTIVCLLYAFVILFSSGCEPLKKKFVRKKKDEKVDEFVPVFQPIEYAVKNVSSEEKYIHNYSLWKVWVREMGQLFQDSDLNYKRVKYTMTQLVLQLTEMEKHLVGEKKEGMSLVIKNLDKAKKELLRPEYLCNIHVVERAVKNNEKDVSNNFNPKKNELF